jgi:hypothetical protein
MADEAMTFALRLVLNTLGGGPTDDDALAETVTQVLGMLQSLGRDVPNYEALVREVESRVSVWQPEETSLEDNTGHKEWLQERRGDISWSFWERYRRYLEDFQTLPPAVIGRVDASTDRVLALLEDPSRPGSWDRRGMVVGQVQSGKTGHYTALACKAVDAGYRLVVVLAGLHNSLRSQTQLRLDEGLLGFDTQFAYRSTDDGHRGFGAGRVLGVDHPVMGSLTTSKADGDFNRSVATRLAMPLGQIPVLLVVKKNASILRNLLEWVTKMPGISGADSSRTGLIHGLPLLVIDDEADNASINTKRLTSTDDEDPTTINRLIRGLLASFEKSAFVAYTATPYANIFITPDDSERHGLDLFPRHFIESLKPPSNYLGPTRVFGLTDQEDPRAVVDPLPITRTIDDFADWIPDRHKKHWVVSDRVPESLERAVRSFLVTCAVRSARGRPSEHNSMLIHVTRFQAVQAQVADRVEHLLETLQYRIKYGDGAATSLLDQLEALWQSDFVPTSKAMGSLDLDWSDVRDQLPAAAAKAVVRTINGTSQDALEYYEKRNTGLSVIAVGGDKLSRGLTLEGLSVSYYLRASRMYDTLMQMGRWFGYRPGYEDLCRLYTSRDLREWYTEITQAAEELRGDFDEMADRGGTPEDYGLRVRTSPAGLTVTAPAKMRNAYQIDLSFSGEAPESVSFSTIPSILQKNWKALENLVDALESEFGHVEPTEAQNLIWRDVPAHLVEAFFQNYRGEPEARRARPELIWRYIGDCRRNGELASWTVAVIGKRSEGEPLSLGGYRIHAAIRSNINPIAEIKAEQRYRIRRVLSPPDEGLDLSNQQIEAAATAADNAGRRPVGRWLREQRSPTSGLLLIYPLSPGAAKPLPPQDDVNRDPGQVVPAPMVGFVASFPRSDARVVSRYAVNEIFRIMELDVLEDLDDE